MEYMSFFDLPGISLAGLWDNVGWMIFFVAPIVMIVVAIWAVGHLIEIVRDSMGVKNEEDPWDDD